MQSQAEHRRMALLGGTILVAYYFAQLVSATTFESCDVIDHSNNGSYGIVKLDIDHCQSQEDCSITKGKNLSIRTLSFIPKVASKSVNMQVLLGRSDSEDHPLQMQMSGLPANGNLCLVQDFLSKQLGNHCQVVQKQRYVLLNYEFFVPRLITEIGNVNLTFLLTGDEDLLSCALVRANFID